MTTIERNNSVLDRLVAGLRGFFAKCMISPISWLSQPSRRDKWYSKHSPNIVTIGRGLIAVALLMLLHRYGHNHVLRAILVTAIGFDLLADGIDGLLAEQLDRQTTVGAVLDAAVDHLVILLGMLFYLATIIAPYITNTLRSLALFCAAWITVMLAVSTLVSARRETCYQESGTPIISLSFGKLKFVWLAVMSGMTLYLPLGPLMPLWLTWVALVPGALLATASTAEYALDLLRFRQR